MRVVLIILCAALPPVSFAAEQGAAAKPPSAKAAAAERLAKKGRTEEAIKIYQEILRENKSDAATASRLADLQAKLGRYDEAASLYAAMFEKKIRKLRAQRQRDLSGEALQLYHRIDTMPHKNPGVCMTVAEALMSMGKLDWARQEIEKALAIDPGYADAYFYLGKNYQLKGDITRAVASLEKAVELDPSNYYARNNLGGLYIQLDRLDDAAKQFTAAIEAKKDNSFSYYNLGVVSVMREDYQKAVGYLRDALTYAPGDMNANELLANIYFEQAKDYRAALPVYEKLLKYKPDITGADALRYQERIRRCRDALKGAGPKPGN